MKEGYEKVKKLGDRLAEVDSLIDWEAFSQLWLECTETRQKKEEDQTLMRL
ncbi:MAG: hypothetical protein ACXQTD_00665 [Candidatus Syntropharchaeia archaeon]